MSAPAAVPPPEATEALPSLMLAGARPFAWPAPNLWSGRSLSDEDVRGLYLFRRTFMDLKPRTDRAADYAHFAAWVRSADIVWLERDSADRPLGMACFKLESRTHEGQVCLVIHTHYVFISPAIRKPAGPAIAVVLGLCVGVWRHPGRPVYLCGAGYLPSFLALAQVFERTWLREDPRMSAWEQSLWHALAREEPGYDPSTQLIDMDTVPRAPRQQPPRDPAVLSRYDEYLRHNPQWTGGYGCVVFVRVGRTDIVRGLRKLKGRMLRR